MAFLTRAANRGSIATGYDIDNSLKLEADNTEYLSRTPSTDTNRQTWTFSAWVKRAELGQTARFIDVFSDGANGTTFGFDTSDRIVVYTIASAVDYGGTYTQRFRDTSAWYHVVWKSDTTNATAANRFQLYVNAVEVTDKEIDYGDPPLNYNTFMNTTTSTYIGYSGDQSIGSSQYMAEIHLIDGQALEPTEFGEFDEDSGIWKPKEYEGSYGTNGFYLDFESSGSLGADSSGNGNNFTLNNITSADQATDTPTNNFATTNRLHKYFTETFTTEGATVVTKNANGWIAPQSTICPASGKWYMEFKFNALDSRILGAAPIGGTLWDSASHYGGTVGSDSVGYADTGYLYVNDSGINSNFGPSYDNSNIIAIALDMDNGRIYWAKDNTWINSADPVAGTGYYALPAGLVEHSIGASVYQQAKQSFANFGGYTTISISTPATDANGYGTFEYAPPSGYYALCSKNLARFG